MKRIPIQSVAGADTSETDLLKLLFCLVEIERQAEIFNCSLEDAIHAALEVDEVDDVWRHIQSALFAAIIVRRFISPGDPRPFEGTGSRAERKRRARAAQDWRITNLRQLLGISDESADNPLFQVKEVRNSLEHIEERIDAAYDSAGTVSISDWYLADGLFIASLEEAGGELGSAGGMRGFDPESGLLMFDREAFSLFALDIEMLKMRHNAREAQIELMTKRRERATFGNLQLRPSRGSGSPQLIEKWRRQRTELEAHMCGRPALDGVRMWMEVRRFDELNAE